jgi:1-acyl-sn-glycerol-3-phosphate acyltransferase
MRAIDEGKSLMIFPEGGIVTKHPPNMVKFKDGAFRVAIEKQIPVVPVTIPFNWIILPDHPELLLNRKLMKIVFHEPIDTTEYTMDRIEELKEKVFNVIHHELMHQMSIINIGNPQQLIHGHSL